MATISCGVMQGGGRGIRASINGLYFIECGVMRGGGRAAGSKIGSTDNVFVIDSWDPANSAEDVDHGHSIKVNLHVENTAELTVLYDEASDFDSTGTHTNTQAVVDHVELEAQSFYIDFQDYTDGVSPLNGSQPDDWLALCTGDTWRTRDQSGAVVQSVDGYTIDEHIALEDAGSSIDGGEAFVDLRWTNATSQVAFCGIIFNATGTGTALRGYSIEAGRGDSLLYIKRVYDGSGSGYLLDTVSITAPIDDTWYRLGVKWENTGTQMNCWVKFWKRGDSEPGWTWGDSDSSYDNPGRVGMYHRGPNLTTYTDFDNFELAPSPAVYPTSGNWQSDPIDVTTVDHYSHALITWDETTPTNTTATVKARWRDIDSWSTCTNGSEIPGIDLGDDMTAGASKDELEIRVELATTDTSVTPEVGNITVHFDPVANSALEIDLDGDHSHTTTLGNLDIWGKAQVSAGTPFTAWDDVWLQTDGPRWVYALGQGLSVDLNYGSVTLDNITFSAARDHWMEMTDLGGLYWAMTPLVYDGAPIEIRWTGWGNWAPMGHVHEWVLIDKNIAIHADAWWIAGHYQLNDNPGMLIAGVAGFGDYPGSMLANAHKLNDHLGQTLVQGWRLDDSPGMVMSAEEFLLDQPGSMIIGAEHMTNNPGMVLMYAVNRDGAIFVNVVDDDTYQALIDEGITFG